LYFDLNTLYLLLFLFVSQYLHHQYLHSFPTRRSSDLFNVEEKILISEIVKPLLKQKVLHIVNSISTINNQSYDFFNFIYSNVDQDRKSTRLNSSHVSISYAVFRLKKENKKKDII